jgi:protein-disulfide isomerase
MVQGVTRSRLLNVATAILGVIAVVTGVSTVQAHWVQRRDAEVAIRVPHWRQVSSSELRSDAHVPTVTVVAFIDYECEACRAADKELQKLRERLGDDVAIITRHYPLAQHPSALAAAHAAVCAEAQERFPQYHRALYDAQEELSDNPWVELAARSEVADLVRFSQCLEDSSVHRSVAEDTLAAAAIGVEGTPTFLINDRLYAGYRQGRLTSLVRRAAQDRIAAGEVERVDSLGTALIFNARRDTILAWRAEPVWRFSTSSSDSRLPLESLSPAQIATDSARRIYILDAAAPKVAVLSEHGRLIREFGRGGSGPGEIRDPMALSVTASGDVGVVDLAKSALVRWSAEGNVLPEVRLQTRYWGPGVRLVENDILIFPARLAANPGRSSLMLQRADTAVSLAQLSLAVRKRADFPSCGLIAVTVPQLFGPASAWDAAGGRVLVAAPYEYIIDVYGIGDARKLTSIRRELPLRRVTEAMALEEAAASPIRNNERCVVPAAEAVKGSGYGTSVAAIRRIAISPGRRVWVERGGRASEPRRIDVFGSNGVYMGTLPANWPFPDAFLTDEDFVAIDTDELDAPRITRYRTVR